jgi:hypothetical protein
LLSCSFMMLLVVIVTDEFTAVTDSA